MKCCITEATHLRIVEMPKRLPTQTSVYEVRWQKPACLTEDGAVDTQPLAGETVRRLMASTLAYVVGRFISLRRDLARFH